MQESSDEDCSDSVSSKNSPQKGSKAQQERITVRKLGDSAARQTEADVKMALMAIEKGQYTEVTSFEQESI